MDEITSPASPSNPVPSHWMIRVLIAVLLAEGIWGLIVSLTRDLLVPFLAQQLGADPQSPLYLGKGVYDFPALFVAILELCFAGIVAAGLNVWVNRGPKAARVRVVQVRKVVAKPASVSVAPAAAGPLSILAAPPLAVAPTPQPKPSFPAPPAPVPDAQPSPVAQPAPPPPVAVQPPAPQKPASPPKPPKPQKPKEVYYNIVGEPINPTEDD
jgi:hypothetical protein